MTLNVIWWSDLSSRDYKSVNNPSKLLGPLRVVVPVKVQSMVQIDVWKLYLIEMLETVTVKLFKMNSYLKPYNCI